MEETKEEEIIGPNYMKLAQRLVYLLAKVRSNNTNNTVTKAAIRYFFGLWYASRSGDAVTIKTHKKKVLLGCSQRRADAFFGFCLALSSAGETKV